MVGLIPGPEDLQDFHSVLGRRLLQEDGLEPALKSGVHFNVLRVFVQGGGSNALHLTPG